MDVTKAEFEKLWNQLYWRWGSFRLNGMPVASDTKAVQMNVFDLRNGVVSKMETIEVECHMKEIDVAEWVPVNSPNLESSLASLHLFWRSLHGRKARYAAAAAATGVAGAGLAYALGRRSPAEP
jgi:hypothetical protein